MAIFFLVSQGSQVDLRALDNIMIARTSDILLRNIVFYFFLLNFNLVLNLRSQYVCFRLTKNQFELKRPILCLTPPPWKTPFCGG